MAEPDEPDKIWDEYDWERFLQQQDRKTEKYMDLLERYIDDPNRDQIIARENGLESPCSPMQGRPRLGKNVDHLLRKAWPRRRMGEEDDDAKEEAEDGFEGHPLYKASFALTVWIDQNFLRRRGTAAKRPLGGEIFRPMWPSPAPNSPPR